MTQCNQCTIINEDVEPSKIWKNEIQLVTAEYKIKTKNITDNGNCLFYSLCRALNYDKLQFELTCIDKYRELISNYIKNLQGPIQMHFYFFF